MLIQEAISILTIFLISAFTCYVGYAYGYEKGHDDVVNKYYLPIVQEHHHGEY